MLHVLLRIFSRCFLFRGGSFFTAHLPGVEFSAPPSWLLRGTGSSWMRRSINFSQWSNGMILRWSPCRVLQQRIGLWKAKEKWLEKRRHKPLPTRLLTSLASCLLSLVECLAGFLFIYFWACPSYSMVGVAPPRPYDDGATASWGLVEIRPWR